MSEFFSSKYSSLVPYVPGEQPRDMQYIKLNTNESPFPPSPRVREAVQAECERLNLYSDPECTSLKNAVAELYYVSPSKVILTNGSDEALNFAFMAFADSDSPLFFPDITYGFYPVFAELNGIPYTKVPLKSDFSINVNDYLGCGGTVVIANPNAPTGLCLSLADIEKIAASNPHNVVIIDEAYVDFGGKSAVSLTEKHNNLLVVQTFSKSRSLAGGRLGFAIGSEGLIADLNTIKYSTNPYNVNRLTAAAGLACIEDNGYYMQNCRKIIEVREKTAAALKSLSFEVVESHTNFLFAKHKDVPGRQLYASLKQRGILVRHFASPRTEEYIRITIGTSEQMDAFINTIKELVT